MRKISKTWLLSTLALLLAAGATPVSFVRAESSPVSMGTPDLASMAAPSSTATQPDESGGLLIPVTGTGKEQVIYDQVNTTTAKQKQSFGGEQFSVGKFERPFDQDMNYLPYLDIIKSTLQREDPNFVYATIQVAVPVSSAPDKPALYGLELDTNLDGRSEFLILAEKRSILNGLLQV